MLKRYFLNNKKRNFSTASIWIKGGSDLDSVGKKGINKILSSLLTRGCEGFDNFALSEYIESYGAELNQEIFEDGISISIKSLNEHFSKLFPLLDLIINKPTLLEIDFQKVKKSSIDFIKKEKQKKTRLIFIDIPLLFENNLEKQFNKVISIIASKRARLKRLKKTRKMTENQFKNITRSQTSDVIRKKKSDYVIYNNSTLKDYKIKINKLISKL